MNVVLRLERRVAFGALRRIVTHPSRRALWFVTVACVLTAFAIDVATSDVASRDLGRWQPSIVLVAAVAAGTLGFAAFAGSRTPLTYGTRAADAVWWRYAAIGTREGQRATTAILTVRATLFVALGAVPVAAALALAAPQRAATIVLLAVVVMVLAPATVLVSSAAAPRTAARGPRSADAVPAVRRSQTRIPRGMAAARWLVARRRGEMVVPYDRFALGLVAGLLAPRLASIAGGQTVALAIVIGGLAVLFDAAVRGTTAPATLRSPWWRAAVGTTPRALAGWAFCDAAGAVSPLAGVAIGLGSALGDVLIAVAAIPAIVLLPLALRLVVFASDTFFPSASDRRGAGVGARAGTVLSLTLLIAPLALIAGAYGGAFPSIATITASLLAVAVAAAHVCAARLPDAME